VIRGSLLISAIINIGHGFENRANEEFAKPPDYKNDLQVGFWNSQFNKTYISQYPSVNTNLYYFVYSVLYFLINFALFFAISTIIEVMILQRMHKELAEKRERMARMNAYKTTVLADSSIALTNAELEDAKKERRVITMVVLNSLVNFLLRFPDFLIFLEDSSKTSESSLNAIFPGFASLLLDISYLAYILTFSFNVLIFYIFNSKFKKLFVIFTTTNENK
jgi:hypothetical protein